MQLRFSKVTSLYYIYIPLPHPIYTIFGKNSTSNSHKHEENRLPGKGKDIYKIQIF